MHSLLLIQALTVDLRKDRFIRQVNTNIPSEYVINESQLTCQYLWISIIIGSNHKGEQSKLVLPRLSVLGTKYSGNISNLHFRLFLSIKVW